MIIAQNGPMKKGSLHSLELPIGAYLELPGSVRLAALRTNFAGSSLLHLVTEFFRKAKSRRSTAHGAKPDGAPNSKKLELRCVPKRY